MLSFKTEMDVLKVLLIILVSGTIVSSTEYNPCQDFEEFKHKRLLEDPSDCSKYYECTGVTATRLSCPRGTSFDPNWKNGDGGCKGPDPSLIPDCYQDKDQTDRDQRMCLHSFFFFRQIRIFELCMFQNLDPGQNGLIVPAPALELVIA